MTETVIAIKMRTTASRMRNACLRIHALRFDGSVTWLVVKLLVNCESVPLWVELYFVGLEGSLAGGGRATIFFFGEPNDETLSMSDPFSISEGVFFCVFQAIMIERGERNVWREIRRRIRGDGS